MGVKQFFGVLITTLFVILILFIYEHRPITTTVLIQAGHEGRTSGNTGFNQWKNIERVDWEI